MGKRNADLLSVEKNVGREERRPPTYTARALAERIKNGDRQALSRAITLAESRLRSHRATALAVVERLSSPRSPTNTRRIGITGPPGAGKSTLISTLGLELVARGHKVAVLAVDPSSPLGGGSILGDKTRMTELAGHTAAFVRPSASRASAGGLGPATRCAVSLCEGAGFDVVIVETVGTGQGEWAVRDVADWVGLVLSPASGDELQGIKRGIVDVADAVVVNKGDGALRGLARSTAAHYRRAMAARNVAGAPESGWVGVVSALERIGVGELCDRVEAFFTDAETLKRLEECRAEQSARAFSRMVREEQWTRWLAGEGKERGFERWERAVARRDVLPETALVRLWSLNDEPA